MLNVQVYNLYHNSMYKQLFEVFTPVKV